MKFNIPDCIIQINKSNNYLKKLVFKGKKIECEPQKVDDGYIINLGLEGEILITNRKKYSTKYNYVLKCIGSTLSNIKILKWEKFKYSFEGIEQIVNTWNNNVFVKQEKDKNDKIIEKGLRKPQIGALYAALSQWTINETEKSNIIVMPTGTGKTETMLMLMLLGDCKKLLVIVPSIALKEQIATKFINLGILEQLGIINSSVKTPFVGILNNLDKADDVKYIIEKSNVVISTMQLCSKLSDEIINKNFSHLFIDEAHHMSAQIWGNIADKFDKKIIQFTATPFRNDGKIIKGKVIYNFPLAQAQEEGYFKHINFEPILVFNDKEKDIAIAKKAIEKLDKDIYNGYDHVIMARVENIERAKEVFKIYEKIGKKYNPRYIYSSMTKTEKKEVMSQLNNKRCRIIICVKMLGEGFDFPELKIAAIHDQHKTLGITLQFIGRFTRSSNNKIGDATAIANIIDEHADQYLNMLYKEDADWDRIISIASNEKIDKHIKITDYLTKFKGNLIDVVPMQNIFPALSFSLYKTSIKKWNILEYANKINRLENVFCSYNEDDNIIVIIKRNIVKMDWSNSENLKELYYDMIIIRFDETKGLIYATSNSSNLPTSYVKMCFKDAKIISGDNIFRSLNNINRLKINTMGLRDWINGYISFRMYAGRDILSGLSNVKKQSVTKNNIYGKGYENGEDITLGCSKKGKVWTRKIGTVYEWKMWCERTASKILDNSIDVNKIIEGINAPIQINEIPNNKIPILIEFNPELYIFNDYIIKLRYKENEIDINKIDLNIKKCEWNKNKIDFLIETDNWNVEYSLILGNKKFEYKISKGAEIEVISSRGKLKLSDWFEEFPPIITFDDGSKLENNLYIDIQNMEMPVYSKEKIIAYDWSKTDISVESQTYKRLNNSIQYNTIEEIRKEGFDIIFDDDGKGEIADIIAIKSNEEKVYINFYHCKYSSDDKPGRRLDDLYQVCGQAQRSVYWKSKLEKMFCRMLERDRAYTNKYGISRFVVGDEALLNIYKNKLKVYDVSLEIYIVQPGVAKEKISNEMLKLLGVTQNWCQETYMIPFNVITNK